MSVTQISTFTMGQTSLTYKSQCFLLEGLRLQPRLHRNKKDLSIRNNKSSFSKSRREQPYPSIQIERGA